jgi:hypothetical protein
MNRSRKLTFLIAALAMAGVFTVACDSGTQEPAAPDGSKSLTAGDATDSQSDSTPSSILPTDLPEGVVAAIPKEFPDEVPIYPGSVPTEGKGMVSDGVPTAAVQLQTADTPEEVFDFYTDKLSQDGWTIEDRDGFEGKNAVSATNGTCRTIMLAAPAENGGTTIVLITEC